MPRTDSNGEKLFKKGKKALATSLFKWSADYLEGSIQFEKAAKSFAASGCDDRAFEAWLEYSKCCEHTNEMTGAAEGLAEAALVCSDYDQSIQMLIKADEFYKIGGYDDRGMTAIKRFAKSLLEKETESATKKAFQVYDEVLMDRVFAGEGNNYLLNTDIPETFLKLQLEAKDFAGAIKTKKRFIEYLRNEGTTDHQIRRSWLEVICLQILLEDFYRIEDSLQHFANEPGHRNIYSQDEFMVASQLKDAISSKDFPKIVEIMKQPIFGFLEIEIVKLLKRFAMNPPIEVQQMAPLVGSGVQGQNPAQPQQPQTKEEALDAILL